MSAEWLDEDGYPNDAALTRIKVWPHDGGYLGLMEFVKSIWAYADWGWRSEVKYDDDHNKPVDVFNISTAGWSGNEDIIRAMQENALFWATCWVQSRRGGHYIFHVRR